MKKATIILAICSVMSAVVLQSCDSNKKNTTIGNMPVATVAGGANKIAYVNIDTLEAKYEVMKVKRDDFQQKRDQMESELQRSFQQMQADAQEVQKKAEANTLTQPEYEAAQKRLYQMQKSLESRKQSLTEQLMKAQDEYTKELKSNIDAFLEEYNKTRHYDYILSYSYAGSQILYVNKQLDITQDVVDGMNAAAKNAADKKGK